MMKKIIVIVCLLLTNIACQKESESAFSGLYSSKRIEIENVKLFSKNNEIKDKLIIQQFINHRNIRYLSSIETLQLNSSISIEFFPDNKAVFSRGNNSKELNVIKKNDYLYLEEKEISTTYNKTPTFQDSYFSEKFLIHFPLYSETSLLNSNTGYFSKTDYKHCIYIKGIGNVIEYPFISYYYIKEDTQSIYMSMVTDCNNEFKKDLILQLEGNDTLLIQEYRTILEKF